MLSPHVLKFYPVYDLMLPHGLCHSQYARPFHVDPAQSMLPQAGAFFVWMLTVQRQRFVRLVKIITFNSAVYESVQVSNLYVALTVAIKYLGDNAAKSNYYIGSTVLYICA